MPVSIAPFRGDSLLVLDWQTNAVVVVAPSGRATRTSPTSDFRILSVGGGLSVGGDSLAVFVGVAFGDGPSAVAEVTLGDSLEVIRWFVGTDSVMRRHSRSGSSGKMSTGQAGSPVFSVTPGLWYRVGAATRRGGTEAHGRHLYRDVQWPRHRGERLAPGRVRAVAPGPQVGQAMMIVSEIRKREGREDGYHLKDRLLIMADDGLVREVEPFPDMIGNGFLVESSRFPGSYYVRAVDEKGGYVARIIVESSEKRAS
jgi:hypothetical protein